MPRDRVCGLDGCTQKHHRLLHDSGKNKKAEASSGSGEAAHTSSPQASPDMVNQDSTHVTHGASDATKGEQRSSANQHTVVLRTLPVVLLSGSRSLVVNALLDDASTRSYMSSRVAAELGLCVGSSKV